MHLRLLILANLASSENLLKIVLTKSCFVKVFTKISTYQIL